jgi:GNAT superfamily N-acetyltransferase
MIMIKTLAATGLATIATAFNKAFVDYVVPFHVDENYLQGRWKAARVDYDLSFGAFDRDELVGFLVFGVDENDGRLTAHNAATGVVPAYRGRGLVRDLYEVALPRLRKAGVKYSSLEVITQNEIAIKAYTSIGYSIKRTLLCFNGEVNIRTQEDSQLIRVKDIPTDISGIVNVYPNTWELSDKALRITNTDYEFWYLEKTGALKAYAIINPGNGFIARIGFENDANEHYQEQLLCAIGSKLPLVKINNIDASESGFVGVLERSGLVNFISQYEMGMEL